MFCHNLLRVENPSHKADGSYWRANAIPSCWNSFNDVERRWFGRVLIDGLSVGAYLTYIQQWVAMWRCRSSKNDTDAAFIETSIDYDLKEDLVINLGLSSHPAKLSHDHPIFSLLPSVLWTMDVSTCNQDEDTKFGVQNAITAYSAGGRSWVRACLATFHVLFQILQHRRARRPPQSTSHEHRQVLSTTEGRALVGRITRPISTGFSASLSLAMKMTEGIFRSQD
ncbi:hypothetical protein K431DRAFT_298271 [Polychaeton citri CBS 116435]|uniref:Uncharacterized protein n=1 Tax=Polychaeton citri CBS 116435 TaxID=1314669 RepID=A0A9P4UKK6_9PEZI|nr:hypothetical protein K431DRAFT_298271 [Polychaeton citri CBS 116435]